jgi:hypothetical protein
MKSVRIGAGLGFYGDSWRAVRASIERGGVQHIASDHLSELTLAILQKDRQKDASAGYARAFRDRGWKATLATVTGDAVLERFDELGAAGEALAHMDTGGRQWRRAPAEAENRRRLPRRLDGHRPDRLLLAHAKCAQAAPTPSARSSPSAAGRSRR